jgi:anti-sigma factor RsiW
VICSVAESLLSAYADHELDGARSLAVRRHLEECPECRRVMEGLLATKLALAQSLPTPAPPSVEAFLAPIGRRERTVPRAWAAALIASSAAVAALLAAWSQQPAAAASEPASVAASDVPYTYSGDTFAGGLPIVPAAYPGD